ncbi:TolC family protein [Legionella fallonii]|uniref:Outer membrane efflux protein n=1 Tax=Legionella fallonii LLAP-10 TaxID=1212491 RepID=A0A098GBB0_9GAMM|nr:TolC family protein [Legionella fallonii]CEG59267.1 Outer membrane efflux protein [Legionella fallonii LLAP-10]
MKQHCPIRWVILIIFVTISFPSLAINKEKKLTLSEAESLALATSPELHRFQAASAALQQQAIAEGQLTDPQLVVGVTNVPTNSFSFTQDEMTMEQVGLQQTFARGRSLSMKSKQSRALALAEHRKAHEKALTLIRNVRETWLELYYWTEALRILQANRLVYKNLFKVTASQYQTGKTNQSDVLQVQLEVSKFNDQEIQIQQQIRVLRAQLERWVGREAYRPLALSIPSWPLPSLKRIQGCLPQHPLLNIDAAAIAAAHSEVAFAAEQYKPGWMLNIGYAKRQGRMPDGMPRSDFVGAQVTVDLPFFPANRQDRQMRAAYSRLAAATFDQQIHYRDLLQVLNTQYAVWNRLGARETVYKRQLIPESRQNAKASLIAYQNISADLNNVLRAYSNELTIELESIQLHVERAKSRAMLLYLEGKVQ